MGSILAGSRLALGVRRGPGQESQLVTLVRRDTELPRLRDGVVGRRGASLALRPDVLPRATRRPQGQGARRRARRRPGRVAEPPQLHRRNRRSDAIPARASGDHAVVPVPEHLRVPHLRPVQRAAAAHRPASGIADCPPPRQIVRLRRSPQRRAPGDRCGACRQGVVGQLGRGARGFCRSRKPASRRRLDHLATPAHGRRVASRRHRAGRSRRRDHRQLQCRRRPRAPVGGG